MNETRSGNDGSRAEGLKKIWELIREIRIAMLTTSDEDGTIHSRPMATQQAEFEGDLWFLTQEHSGKVRAIEHGSQVNLTYVDKGGSSFVSLSGKAEVSQERSKIHELWKPMHKAWFPGGENDPEIVVLKVAVEEAEYWEAPSNAIVRNYQLLKKAATGGRSQVGEHQKVSL